jgi:hypothetical protein
MCINGISQLLTSTRKEAHWPLSFLHDAVVRILYEECIYIYIIIIIKSLEENEVPQTLAHCYSGFADSIMNSVFDWRTWLFNYRCRVSDLYGRRAPACLY